MSLPICAWVAAGRREGHSARSTWAVPGQLPARRVRQHRRTDGHAVLLLFQVWRQVLLQGLSGAPRASLFGALLPVMLMSVAV